MAQVRTQLGHDPWGRGLCRISDVAANDSDKSLVAPSDERWLLRFLRIEFTATGDAGSRLLTVELFDAADDLMLSISLTDNEIIISEAMVFNLYPDALAVAPVDAGVEGSNAIPENLLLGPGWYVKVKDSAGIQATTDDMILHAQVAVF